MSRPSPLLRRGLIFSLSLITGALASAIWANLLFSNGITAFDVIQIALFVPGILWVSVFFWSCVMGWGRQMVGGRVPGIVYPEKLEAGQLAPELSDPAATPLAIVVPVRNEDVAAVFGRIMAMDEALKKTGHEKFFHFFVLSDTNDADMLIDEELVWAETVKRLDAKGRLFYRRRPKNPGRKAGNLADFCTRWGAHYSHMIVLDADSLLTADVLLTLGRLGRLNPKAGIIQAMPSIVGANSFFARSQQFAARLYGPVLGAGISYWHLGDGNYWGHNAIINVAFFTAHCGLPQLAGGPPFGGHILSHDIAEAALMVRGGWQVWLVPELVGSYEQMPSSLIENSKRERRWIQGNLQHSRLLFVAGLHPLSRLHLLMGITAYLMPVASLLFLITGLASAIYAGLVPPDYFGDNRTLFPSWPIFDGNLALLLFASVMMLLTLPKVLAAVAVLSSNKASRAWGGRLRLLASVLVEHGFTILMAPIMMLVQSGFVVEVLRGKDSGWGAQNRDDLDTTWAQGWALHKWHMAFGVALALVSWQWAPSLFMWLLPVSAGLILAAPISVISSQVRLGVLMRRLGLLWIPEEKVEPAEITSAHTHTKELAGVIPQTPGPLGHLERLFDNPADNALHLSLLPENSLSYADPDELAKARRKVAFKLRGEAVPPLSASEKLALLYDEETLSRLPLGVAPTLP